MILSPPQPCWLHLNGRTIHNHCPTPSCSCSLSATTTTSSSASPSYWQRPRSQPGGCGTGRVARRGVTPAWLHRHCCGRSGREEQRL